MFKQLFLEDKSEDRSISKMFHCGKSVLIRRFSYPYFPAFGLNTIQIISPYSVRMRENTDQKNSELRHFYAVFPYWIPYVEIAFRLPFWIACLNWRLNYFTMNLLILIWYSARNKNNGSGTPGRVLDMICRLWIIFPLE